MRIRVTPFGQKRININFIKIGKTKSMMRISSTCFNISWRPFACQFKCFICLKKTKIWFRWGHIKLRAPSIRLSRLNFTSLFWYLVVSFMRPQIVCGRRPWALNGSHRPPTEFYRTYMDKNFDTFISRFGEMLSGFVFPHFSTPSGGEKINEFSTSI